MWRPLVALVVVVRCAGAGESAGCFVGLLGAGGICDCTKTEATCADIWTTGCGAVCTRPPEPPSRAPPPTQPQPRCPLKCPAGSGTPRRDAIAVSACAQGVGGAGIELVWGNFTDAACATAGGTWETYTCAQTEEYFTRFPSTGSCSEFDDMVARYCCGGSDVHDGCILKCPKYEAKLRPELIADHICVNPVTDNMHGNEIDPRCESSPCFDPSNPLNTEAKCTAAGFRWDSVSCLVLAGYWPAEATCASFDALAADRCCGGNCPMCPNGQENPDAIADHVCYDTAGGLLGNGIDPSCNGCVDPTSPKNTESKCAEAGGNWFAVTCEQAVTGWPEQACDAFTGFIQGFWGKNICCQGAAPTRGCPLKCPTGKTEQPDAIADHVCVDRVAKDLHGNEIDPTCAGCVDPDNPLATEAACTSAGYTWTPVTCSTLADHHAS